MKKLILKYLTVLIVLVMSINMLSIQVLADGTVVPVEGKISVQASGATSGPTPSDGVVTITRTGSMFSASTATITIKNIGGKQANISFTYAFSGVGSAKLNGSSVTSGTYSGTLDADATISMTLTGSGGWKTGTLTLSNFSWTEVSATATATVTYNDTKGSVTLGGAAVASGGTATVTGGTIAAVATPKSGCSFLGWVNTATNEIMNTAAGATLNVPSDMSIQAVFVTTASDSAWFMAGNQYLYNNLNQAATKAASLSDKVVVLMNNGTLPANADNLDTTAVETVYTIPSGVTLLVPYDISHTVVTTSEPPISSTGSYTKPTAYRTLTMASGANITLNGKLSVAGSLIASQTNGYNGLPNGPTGQINMNSGSSISVESGAVMYVYGFIYGSGSVEVKTSGTVYECFQLRDFRGGDATSTIHGDRGTKRLFPMMQYYVQNVQVPMKLHAGSIEIGISCFNFSYGIGYTQKYTEIPFIGSSGMFNITDGYIIKDYEEATDRLNVSVNGSLAANNYKFSINISAFGNITLESKDYIIPINHNITVDIQSGSLVINQDIALLPGAQIIVGEGTTCTLGSGTEVILYDGSNWGYYIGEKYGTNEAGVAETNTWLKPTLYMAGGTIFNRRAVGFEGLADAAIVINGEVDASLGQIYTTTSGARITSDGNGILKLGAPGTLETAYQATQKDTTISYVGIALTPAQLQHANKTYLATADITGTAPFTYTYKNSFWHKPGCDGATETTETKATCTEAGTSITKCTCEIINTTKEIPALGHTEVTDAAVAPTCTETGLTEGKHCSVCNEVIVAQEVVAARGYHDWLNGECQFSGCDAVFQFASTNVAVHQGLDLYFYIDKDDVAQEGAGFYVKLTKQHADEQGSVPIELALDDGEWEDYNSTLYRVGYSDIAAKEMMDDITAVVYYADGRQASRAYTESIKKYAHNVYKQSGANQPKLGPALADMLNYGAACQILFDYNAENLANDDESDGLMNCAKNNELDLVEPAAQKKGAYYYGSTFSAKNKLMFTFYFDFDEDNDGVIDSDVAIDDAYALISYYNPGNPSAGSGEIRVNYANWYKRTDTLYGIDIIGIPIGWGRTAIECSVYAGDGTIISSGNVDSIVGYTNRTDDSKVDLLSTMHNLLRFVDSANIYFNSVN